MTGNERYRRGDKSRGSKGDEINVASRRPEELHPAPSCSGFPGNLGKCRISRSTVSDYLIERSHAVAWLVADVLSADASCSQAITRGILMKFFAGKCPIFAEAFRLDINSCFSFREVCQLESIFLELRQIFD